MGMERFSLSLFFFEGEFMKFNIKRILGYLLGFCLFYAPFAFFQKGIYYLMTGKSYDHSIHSFCVRIPLEHILDGRLFQYSLLTIICMLIVLISAFFFGPVFCGKLCPAGAFTEYLSKLCPDKWKISWSKYTDIVPLRYGMLAGFLLVPFFDGILACAYCNFYVFDLLVNYAARGYFISFTSSMLLTLLLWLVVLGIFTKGGRGFCNFLCPVGAMQNLVYFLGSKLPFTYKMQVNHNQCIGCGKCVKKCPMEAVRMKEKKAEICKHNCIICGVCEHVCPVQAIYYGRSKHEK